MKVGINALLINQNAGGVTVFLRHLVRHMSREGRDVEFYLYATPGNQDLIDEAPNIKKILFPAATDVKALRAVLEQTLLPHYLRRHGIDVFLNTGSVGVLRAGCPQAFVVQAPLTLRDVRREAPREVSPLHSLYYNLLMDASLRASSVVIAVSKDIQRRILLQTPIKESKVRVIYEGVEIAAPPDNSAPPVEGPYILFVSTLYRYKNADKLLRAFGLLKRRYALPHRLLILGKPATHTHQYLRGLAEEEGIGQSVTLLGALPHPEVALYMKHAEVFVYPSSVESFGIPVVEAMILGTPVVASNRMSVPEVAGDAALLVEPEDTAAMAEAIYRAATDMGLREELISKGRKRAGLFQWTAVARQYLELFRQMATPSKM